MISTSKDYLLSQYHRGQDAYLRSRMVRHNMHEADEYCLVTYTMTPPDGRVAVVHEI